MLNGVPGVRWYNLQELLQEGQKCTLTSFFALEKRSYKKMKKEQGIFFTTMLQPPIGFGQVFLSKENYYNTGAFFILCLGSSQFYLFPRLKLTLKGRLFYMLMSSLRMNERAEKDFTKSIVSKIFIVAGRNVYLHKGNMWKEM